MDPNFVPTFEYSQLCWGNYPLDFGPDFVAIGFREQSSEGASDADWSDVHFPFVFEKRNQLRLRGLFSEEQGVSPLPQRVARVEAAVAQSSSAVAKIALFRCNGVTC